MNIDQRTETLLKELYNALVARFGHRGWWPGDSPFEVCVGAILTQNTAWKNVAKAIENLKLAEALDPFVLYSMPQENLAELIRPAGYYNVKAKRLRNLLSLIVEEHEGDLDSLFSLPMDDLRTRLLSVNGVGFETADSIILYAAGKPIFVVDAYTGRVLKRHGLVDQQADYRAMQEFFHARLPRDADLYNDFHAQIVAVGHHYCKRKALCDECPLVEFLPGSKISFRNDD
jgi:endonuclease III related protein